MGIWGALASKTVACRADPPSPWGRPNPFGHITSIAVLASLSKHLFENRLQPRLRFLAETFRRTLNAIPYATASKRFITKRLVTRVLALAVAYSLAMPVYSAPIYCRGKVNNTYIDATGTITIYGTWRADYTQLCNTKVVYIGIDPTTCFTWFSIALASQTKGLDVIASYDHASAPACNTLPTYGFTPAPRYFMLVTANVP